VEKMRFSLKTSKYMYGLKIGRIVQCVTAGVWPRTRTYGPECDKGLYFHQAVP
jgi:hypothetical protein